MDFDSQMRAWVAYTSVGASTVRGLRTPGVVSALRKLLAQIDLNTLEKLEPSKFAKWLDEQTIAIKKRLPQKARFWGVARKCLNIFLRGACYNFYLRKSYQLQRIEQELELPLDSITVKKLKENSPANPLPRWLGVKRLRPEDSSDFQQFARQLAQQRDQARIHLDIDFWGNRLNSD